MGIAQAAKWIVGLVAAGAVLLLVSLFVADRRLAPPFEEAELEPIDVPAGDPLAGETLLFSSDQTGNLELYTQPVAGGEVTQLTADADYESWRPRLSPDRSTILFYRTPAGTDFEDRSQASLWMIDAQGGQITQVLPPRSHGWTGQGGAEWSPRGDELVMMGQRPQGFQIWVSTIDGRAVRSLVRDAGDNTDPSWDPTGERVVYVACPQAPCDSAQREVFAIQSAGGERIQLTNDDVADEQPRFSPDGDQIAMRSQVVRGDEDGIGAVWDIRVVPTNRTRSPARLLGDDSVSGGPVWLDSQTVIFHRVESSQATADIVRMRVSTQGVESVVATDANEIYADFVSEPASGS